jgi:hypothetical protein
MQQSGNSKEKRRARILLLMAEFGLEVIVTAGRFPVFLRPLLPESKAVV